MPPFAPRVTAEDWITPDQEVREAGAIGLLLDLPTGQLKRVARAIHDELARRLNTDEG